MSMNKPDIEQIQRAVATSLREHWVLFLVEGIILIILGLAAGCGQRQFIFFIAQQSDYTAV
jgi:hypothetical protein